MLQAREASRRRRRAPVIRRLRPTIQSTETDPSCTAVTVGTVKHRASFIRRSGRLVADPSEDQVGRARRTRRWAFIGSGIILALATVGGFLTVTANTPRPVPAATLSPVAVPEYTPPPPPTEPAVPANLVTDTVSGQRVFLRPATAGTVGIAYLLPDSGDDASTLLVGGLADALNAAGLAIATGDLGGTSWGSPTSTTSLSELRAWVEPQVGDVPVLYFGVGMGATTAVAALSREPDVPVACTYAVAPVTDLATVATADPRVRQQIVTAWGGIPDAAENPSLLVPGLPTDTVYRVIVPAAPEGRVADANAFVASLQESGHTVTSLAASADASIASLSRDILVFGQECLS